MIDGSFGSGLVESSLPGWDNVTTAWDNASLLTKKFYLSKNVDVVCKS